MRKRKAPARARAPEVSPPAGPGGGSVPPTGQFIIPIEDRAPAPAPTPALADTSPPVDDPPPPGYLTKSVELGLVLGLITGLATVLVAVCACFWCYRRRRRRRRRREDGGSPGGPKDDIEIALRPLPSRNSSSINSSRPSSAHRPGTNIFTYEELETATSGFSGSNLLGQGGFGYVHRGVLPDGREVAVKQLKVGSLQGDREFRAEVDIIGRVHHKHLVSLLGYCHSAEERILVYEFLPNKTLNFHLHGKDRPAMSWETRMKIARGSAQGLAYLHGDCRPKIIHRDIKAANILLDFNFEPKVADFGLAKFLEADAHVSTRIMGTFGYLAPEYASSGKVSHKSDVFSFGVLLLELLTGRRPVDRANPAYTDDSMVTWARPILIKALSTKILDDLIDPKLQKNYDPDEMERVMVCAALCVRHSPIGRPTMVEIVRALEGNLSFENLYEGTVPSDSSGDLGYNPNRYKKNAEKIKMQALEGRKIFMKL